MKVVKKIACVIGYPLFLAVNLGYALDTQVVLQADSEITPTGSETVTFGLPLKQGEVISLDEIRVLENGNELPVNVEAGLRYHWADNSLRSVTIQLQNVDMRNGARTLRITDDGRNTANDIPQQPILDGWTQAGANKGNMLYPRIFALHDISYLADTGIVPPYEVSSGGADPVERLQSNQFDNWAGDLDYSKSTAGNWLFDRSSAMFKVYLTTGKVKYLKEAILSKQFYFSHVRNDGSKPSPAGGSGCFTYAGVACADGKYIAPQQAKLAWALVGDNTQWDKELVVNMALQADLGWNQYGTRDTYDSETEGFTERAAGLIGLAEINAYEITGDQTILNHLNERITSLKDMQQTEKPWDQQNGWTPKSGAFTHSWNVHEGNFNEASAPRGVSDDRRFSPWMSENIADFLWQTYNITGNPNIPEMLRQLGNAIDLFGFASNYVNGSGLSANYIRRDGIEGYNKCGGANQLAVELMYTGSAYASNAALNATHQGSGFTDTHNVEVVLPLALAYKFETNSNARQRLAARIENMIEQWTETRVRDCSTIFDGVYRLWNWQHRSNSLRTWQWIKNNDSADTTGNTVSPPMKPQNFVVKVSKSGTSSTTDAGTTDNTDTTGGSGSGTGGSTGTTTDTGSSGGGDSGSNSNSVLVFVATTSCSTGDDPHWQCGGQWQDFNNVQDADYIAICPGAEGAVYDDCYASDRFVKKSDVAAADGYFVCASSASIGAPRTACSSTKWVTLSHFNSIDSVVSGIVTGSSADYDAGTGSTDSSNTDAGTSTGALAFQFVSTQAFDRSPDVPQAFWAGMPDVNGDGCLDIFIGSHTDEINSNMLIQNNNGGCTGTFTYFPDADNYSQAAPVTPRITSRYIWGNWFGHPQGMWSFVGSDVDGQGGARYVLDPGFNDVGGKPQYLRKSLGCVGSRPKCLPLDIDGDNRFEMVLREYDAPYNAGFIVDKYDYSVKYKSNGVNDQFTQSLMVVDVDNDGIPEVINAAHGGYFKFDPVSKSMNWVAGRFPAGVPNVTGNHKLAIDYDSDGDMDIVIGRGYYDQAREFSFHVYQNNGTGVFTDVTTQVMGGISLTNTPYHTTYANSVVADINNDGYPDIIWGGAQSDNNIGLLINVKGERFEYAQPIDFTPVNFGLDSRRPWINYGDYNNDGLIDLVHNGAVSNNNVTIGTLIKNVTNNGNRWLRVRVRGQGENTDGVHSSITAFEPGTQNVISHYQVGAFSSGYQNLITHLGLGNHDKVDLKIDLPHNGGSCLKQNVSVNRDVVVFSDCRLSEYTPGNAIPLN